MTNLRRILQTTKQFLLRHKNPAKERRNSIHWTGRYNSWQDALEHSEGYDSELILTKLLNSSRKIVQGQALFERDTFLFDEPDWNWQLLSSLFLALSDPECSKNIVDYGGALGSTYFQNKKLLEHVRDLKWQVIEQPHIAAVGRNEFTTDVLSFADNLNSVTNALHGILILSGVLQCLSEPDILLRTADSMRFRYIILDRTAFISEDAHHLCIQHVPDWIYKGSYPCWFFNEKRLLSPLCNNYAKIFDFPSKYDCRVNLEGGLVGYFNGLLLKRKS
jgi:putative methyltransferase (TIGR04325 family)